jgi:hypothetical protein
VWKVVLGEASSRGGVREFEVQRGRITAERVPSGRGGGGALDLNRLNIDSDGAFTIVDQEAKKANLPFDRVDYLLSNGGRGGAPVWHLEMYDGRKGRVGSLEISADSGNVITRDFQGGRGPVAQDDGEFLREHTERDRPPAGDRDYYDRGREDYPRRVARDEEELGPGITDIFGKIERHFQKRGRQFKSFFGR